MCLFTFLFELILFNFNDFILFYFVLFCFEGMSWGDATVFVLQKQTESRKWRHGELVEGDSNDVGNVLWNKRTFFESEECSSINLGYK